MRSTSRMREEGQAVPRTTTYSAYVESGVASICRSEHGRNHGSVPARGENELRLIAESGFRSSRLVFPASPFFIRFLNEECATQTARDWKAKNSHAQAG